MADLTPRTRSESFLNGEDLEPITRREYFYAGRESELPAGHQEPKTREEWFIQKYREAGDVTVESLSITENGTYTAPSGKAYSPVSVDVPLPDNAYLLKSIENVNIATFTDGTDNFLKSLEVAIEPQQDLHGYDAPWVGGAGKNKLQTTATSQTVNGVTFTVNSDGTIKATGKATSNVWFAIDATNWGSYSTLANKGFTSSLILNGCPSGGSGNTFALGMRSENSSNLLDAGNGVTITDLETNTYYPAILIYNGYEIPSGGLLFKPMLRLSTVSDSTFAPYSNICPISGHTETNVVVSPTTSAEDGTTYNIQFRDGDNPLTVYGGTLDVVSGELKVVPYYDSYNDETLEGEWISDRDVYAVGTTPTIGAQVVNIGATPQTIQLTPTIIKSLQGENNLFASTGEILDATYVRNANITINDLIRRIETLES